MASNNRTPLMRDDEVRERLLPVVLGGDVLTYTYVREFHRAYRIERCIVISQTEIAMTKSSRFTDCRVVEHVLSDAEVLYATLEKIAAEERERQANVVLMVVGTDDRHATMLGAGIERLESAGYVVPYNTIELQDAINPKRAFYDMCEELDIPYPKTWYFSCGEDGPDELPLDEFDYPLIAKPSDSATFSNATIEGKRKCYEIDSPEEMAHVWQTLKVSDYVDDMVIQDFIPGDDTALRTLTVFCDDEGDVRVVSGGIVCLQDHNPTALGNPVCIMGDKVPEIIECAKRFCKHVGYRSFGNFDIKYDERDGSYRFFEINTRCGRNTYYMSLSGVNFVTLFVEYFLLGHDIPYIESYDPFLFCTVPPTVLKKSIKDPELLARVMELFRSTKDPYPLLYAPDTFLHNYYARAMRFNHIRKFKKFYWDTDGKQFKE